jgi:hypothetical protein
MQRSAGENSYHWQWYSRVKSVSGRGTFSEPFQFAGERATCRLAFHTPEKQEHTFRIVKGEAPMSPIELGLLRVNMSGVRVRFLALAVASKNGEPEPRLRPGPEINGVDGSASIVVEGEGFEDLIVWQPEETADSGGRRIDCGRLKTDARIAMVRTGPDRKALGYVMGDGTMLEFAGSVLARSSSGFSVSADSAKAMVSGKRRARQNMPPIAAVGEVRLPRPGARLWVDGEPVERATGTDGLTRVGQATARSEGTRR